MRLGVDGGTVVVGDEVVTTTMVVGFVLEEPALAVTTDVTNAGGAVVAGGGGAAEDGGGLDEGADSVGGGALDVGGGSDDGIEIGEDEGPASLLVMPGGAEATELVDAMNQVDSAYLSRSKKPCCDERCRLNAFEERKAERSSRVCHARPGGSRFSVKRSHVRLRLA